MGTGNSGRYSGTYGSHVFPGSIDYMPPEDPFSIGIKKRKDIDANGFYDVVAHGKPNSILVKHNGEQIEINHRTLAKLLSYNKESAGKPIRLLSCNTGKVDAGFAQNLANKLNRPIKAPTEYLWVSLNGTYFVAGGKKVNNKLVPDFSRPGTFKTYKPKRRKN